MAGELGIPMVRLVDGTGGGGSVKTYETTGYTYVPRNPAWEHVVDNLARVPVVALGLGLGRGARRGAPGDLALFADGERHLADVRRRPAGRGAARREGHQGRAGRHRDPCPQRRGRRRGRERGRGLRPHAAVPLLPAVVGRRRRRPPAEQRRSRPARGLPDRGDAARPAQGLPHPPDRRGVRRSRLVLRDRQDVGPLGRHRPRPGRRLAGRGAGERSRISTAAAGRPTPATR